MWCFELHQYENDEQNGFGSFVWKNGSHFCGFWLNGKRHGFGIFANGTVPRNSSYNGNWNHDKMDGYGILKDTFNYKNGPGIISYEGIFRDNMKCGSGNLTARDNKYVGEFFNDTPHGLGVMTDNKDELNALYTRMEGLFYQGQLYVGTVKMFMCVRLFSFFTESP